jgi:hypothetical protein
MTTLTKTQAKQAAERSAWDTGQDCPTCHGEGTVPGGRRVIHSFIGGLGADWDVAAVLAAIDEADEITALPSRPLGHRLAVRKGTGVTLFDVEVED